MISQPLHLLSPAEPGSVQARKNPQSGIRDFGALLQAHEAEENAQSGAETANQRKASSNPSAQDRERLAANSSESARSAIAVPVVNAVDAGTPGGSVELVSIPWRLQPNAGLSYLATTTVAEEEAVSPDEQKAPVSMHTDSMSPGGARVLAATLESDLDMDLLPLSQSLSTAPESEPTGPTPMIDAEMSAAAKTQTALAWPERLLRWLPDAEDQSSTAWIRDYRMDPSQATAIIASLQSLAKQQGVRLSRIVLNGQQIWHSTSNPHFSPRA